MGGAAAAYQVIADMEHPRVKRLRQRLLYDYMGFCIAYGIRIANCEGAQLAYVNYLHNQGSSYRTIMNYISVLKQSMKRLRVPYGNWESDNIKAFIKAISKKSVGVVRQKSTLSASEIETLFQVNAGLPNHLPYALAFSLALFAFLRISNLVLGSEASFVPCKQLSLRDVALSRQGATITLRWAKNLQRHNQTHVVKVPFLPTKPFMCPTHILFELAKRSSSNGLTPLVNIQGRPLTERKIRQHLAEIMRLMGLSARAFTFHDYRRTEATMAFSQHVPLDVIKTHGAWASDAVWYYIKNSDSVAAQVPHALSMLFR